MDKLSQKKLEVIKSWLLYHTQFMPESPFAERHPYEAAQDLLNQVEQVEVEDMLMAHEKDLETNEKGPF